MTGGARLIGTPVDRVDGRRKVTGAAQYSAEVMVPNLAHAVLVGSTVPSGRVVGIDTTAAEEAPGVALVLTHRNRGPLGPLPMGLKDLVAGGTVAESRPPLADTPIRLNVGGVRAWSRRPARDRCRSCSVRPSPHRADAFGRTRLASVG